MKRSLTWYYLAILCLTVSFFVILLQGLSSIQTDREVISENGAWYYEETNLKSFANARQFHWLSEAVHYADARQPALSEEAEDHLDIGRYYIAARNYQSYLADGDSDEADKYLQEMAVLAENEFLSPYVESIHTQLGITK